MSEWNHRFGHSGLSRIWIAFVPGRTLPSILQSTGRNVVNVHETDSNPAIFGIAWGCSVQWLILTGCN
jgi:hypothetical protein